MAGPLCKSRRCPEKGNLPWNKGISTHCADSNEAFADSCEVSDPPSTQIKANRTVRMKKVNKQCLLDTPRTVRVSEKTWQVIVRTRRP